ncbi:exo-beta-N-acetylmuramidase NamZ family protein [Caldithrix abyssi]
MKPFLPVLFIFLTLASCQGKSEQTVVIGLDRVTEYRYLFENKNLGIIANHTAFNSRGEFILNVFQNIPGAKIKALFGPEHGFRGNYAAGKKIDEHSLLDSIPIYSLYGKDVKPTPEMLANIDVLIFDIQDIGARFYTYIWTMALAMEAAAEQNIPFVVLDRPNPINGKAIEGPLLDTAFASFVGLFSIPVRHGMTAGELATMFNGEGWLKNSVRAKLQIVPMKNWQRSMWYDQTGLKFIAPSPNMPDLATATVYPGMCLLEGTNVSEGRGTEMPFLQFGAPWIKTAVLLKELRALNLPGVQFDSTVFRPQSIPGKAVHPKFENQRCYGIRLRVTDRNAFRSFRTGVLVIKALHDLHPEHFAWRAGHFDRLCGTDAVRLAIEKGENLDVLFEQWEREVETFQKQRQPYLLY